LDEKDSPSPKIGLSNPKVKSSRLSRDLVYPALGKYLDEGFNGEGISIAVLDTGLSMSYLRHFASQDAETDPLINLKLIVDCTIESEEF
jgi:hypothetical protein